MESSSVVNLTFEKVSFVQKISIILKATSNDDSPIPGFLYQEVNNITLESDGYCHSTLDYLVDRLNNTSCHVKLKVLKIMKYIVENGHPNFRLGLMKSSKGISEATKFSGPPDPLHGNVPYQVVRKAAKELSELLFDIEKEREPLPAVKPSAKVVIATGIGSSPKQSSSKMEGFGNISSAPQKTLGQKFMQNIGDIVDSLTEPPVDYQREVLSALEAPGSYKPPQKNFSALQSAPGQNQQKETTVMQKKVPHSEHIPGRAGGGWEDSDEEEEEQTSTLSSSGHKSSDSTEITKRLDQVALEDWSMEVNLVNSVICRDTQTFLTHRDIKEFTKSCGAHNCDRILESIIKKLKEEDTKIIMKCLILIENMIQSDLLNIDHIVKMCQHSLVNLVQNKSGPVTIKAKKIIRILEWMTKSSILPNMIPLQSWQSTSVELSPEQVNDNN